MLQPCSPVKAATTCGTKRRDIFKGAAATLVVSTVRVPWAVGRVPHQTGASVNLRPDAVA